MTRFPMSPPRRLASVNATGPSRHRPYATRITEKDEVIDIDEDDDLTVKIKRFFIPDDDETEDEECLSDDDGVRELMPHELNDLQIRFKQLSRNSRSDVPLGYEPCQVARTETGSYVRAGLTVELDDGDFLYVHDIFRHRIQQNAVIIKGILMRRNRRVSNCLPKRRNELCAILQDVQECKDARLDSCLVSFPITCVIQTREVIFTNCDFPAFSFRCNGTYYPAGKVGEAFIEETAVLVCRWKYVQHCCSASGKVVSGALMRLRETETSPGKGTCDIAQKLFYRRELSKPFTSDSTHLMGKDKFLDRPKYSRKRTYAEVIDLTQSEAGIRGIRRLISKVQIRDGPQDRRTYTSTITAQPRSKLRYTFGDICAGVGGMTRGASDAGFEVKFVLDHWAVACNTLRLNWASKGTQILETSIFRFLNDAVYENGDWIVDVLHISFPCNTYSPAHTLNGKKDPENEAAGYSVIPLLAKIKPRVVTLEQTAGLLIRHPQSFQALIHQLTAAGYSVRWKIWNCAELGNGQGRKRLFIIASCPGEPLPPFPEATHGEKPGLQPFVTVAGRLRHMPNHIDPHMRAFTSKPGARPYDPNFPLRSCITTNGGESDIHPSGGRSFNMEQLARLVGLPTHHSIAKDCMTNIRILLGNAVPSMVGEKHFTEVKKSMEAEDIRAARYRAPVYTID